MLRTRHVALAPRGRLCPGVPVSIKETSMEERRKIWSHRESPGITCMQVVDDVELDAIRVYVFALLLRAARLHDVAILHLAAILKTPGDVFSAIRIGGAVFLGLCRSFGNVVCDESHVVQAVVTERFVARLVVEDRQ